MRIRCGRCRTQFDVPGPGRFPCPACGTPNQVGEPEPARPEPAPYRKVACAACGFAFSVGEVDTVPCPNCGEPVEMEESG